MKYDELITIGPNEVVETRPFPPFLYEENHAIVAWFHKALAMSQLKKLLICIIVM